MSKINFSKKYYIYSTHKTSTQSLRLMFDSTCHIHRLCNAKYTKNEFINDLKKYVKNNNRKLKIITTLRIPSQRIISSYFQMRHTDEISSKNVKENETTIMKNNVDFLVNNVKNWIRNKKYPKESLYEMMDIFNFTFEDIVINKKKNYGFYKNNLMELYIIDFESVIGEKKLQYLENIFGSKFIDKQANKSNEKIYYNKYKKVKQIIGDEFKNLIDDDYIDLINLKKNLF